MGNAYDAIVVGARCAGSPSDVAGPQGYRVLAVDRATFPSDTISTHLIHTPGVAALKRWGLLDGLLATGCPPIDTYAFDFGPFTIAGAPGIDEAPRLLPTADDPRQAAGGRRGRSRRGSARGVHRRGDRLRRRASRRHQGPRKRRQGPSLSTPKWSSGPMAGTRWSRRRCARAIPREAAAAGGLLHLLEWAADGRPASKCTSATERGFAAWPTHDGLTLVIAGWPYAEFAANRQDIEGNYLEGDGAGAGLCRSVCARARREERFPGAAVPNYFRKPYGPWLGTGR